MEAANFSKYRSRLSDCTISHPKRPLSSILYLWKKREAVIQWFVPAAQVTVCSYLKATVSAVGDQVAEKMSACRNGFIVKNSCR